MNNYDYPLGADNENAPWNQSAPDPIDVDCCVSYSLSKSMPISVSDYTIINEYDSDIDDDGRSIYAEYDTPNFEDTDFEEDFRNDSYAMGIPELLNHLQNLCIEKIEKLQDEHSLATEKSTKDSIRRQIDSYSTILEASKGWSIDELCVVPE